MSSNNQNLAKPVIHIMSLYPKDMNIYGDYGNVQTIIRRCEMFGYDPIVHEYNQGDEWPEQIDMVLGGGGQDTGQKKILEDLHEKAQKLQQLADDDVPMLMICGLYQLFGEYFDTIDGDRLEGIGIFNAHTVGNKQRIIGNIVTNSKEFGRIIGYENHSGQTFLHSETDALGFVDNPLYGNNPQDTTEGARYKHVIGTYLHGSLLPKNPNIADYLIKNAAMHRYGSYEPTIDEQLSQQYDEIIKNARNIAMSRPR
ncbi:MAG: glutamine amidotransferase [Bifidobacteriaceae bacterium]|nr:glutamine amidotransferase [Bifidobacteriaceae bacterium]